VTASGPLPPCHCVAAAFQALGALEVGQHVLVGPALQAHLAPLVVVAGVAADVDHAVDGGLEPPQPLPRGHQSLRLLRLGSSRSRSPSCRRPWRRSAADAGRHPTIMELSFTPASSSRTFTGVLGQPVGQHATGRAGADDDVVVPVHARTPGIARSDPSRHSPSGPPLDFKIA
jgi:hypothetical protein